MILFDTNVNQEKAIEAVNQIIAEEKGGAYMGGSLTTSIDEDTVVLNISCEDNTPELRKALAKCYLKNKTKNHCYWDLAQSLLTG
jgi:hypothetical protein